MAHEPLGPQALTDALGRLDGWSLVEGRLQKEFHFANFQAAFAWMTGVAFLAEAAGHHPDWRNCYDRVTVALSTHDAGNAVTQADIDLAEGIERVARAERT